MTELPVVRLRFEAEVKQPLAIPYYGGSMLRGAFGHALRRLACMTRQRDCSGCPLVRSCPYTRLFAPPPPSDAPLHNLREVPPPYVIEAPAPGKREWQPGERFHFHMVLLGPALAELALVVEAWRRALAAGLGRNRSRLDLQQVYREADDGAPPQLLWQPGEYVETPKPMSIGELGEGQDGCLTLCLRTPLRLQQRGRILSPDMLDARTLLTALLRRHSLLSQFYGVSQAVDSAALAQQASQVSLHGQLYWSDWHRWSSRQRQKMGMGGLLGQITLQGQLTPFLQALHWGQYTHIGKNASFGLGHYHLQAAA
ncbi:CRISPR system precrRNA processing endoribonuclease RAMP protein Cas6 [Microbulbifer flavimaris]|uniref:CRISPR system precrRNA processing endoribonuclease RAMP protein Cas6 n=1 Tax=Microbulbifer flavimaris TaxID=1781068 RepID=A0ABX4I0W7_9GAMM|nr:MULTISPECIES: CRISPR system precrRNA processing endoribonuclease RAMP protein Cas6 [Microbulbifer]KUJ83441.1 hypothetical protein AVO43_06140 [Microbulbifer sp. ZGT114]PCO05597.1 CRISPR system precrRNA processing endoribonuclease RAMP protein Cas6 [Microbulbifer flavimaris]